MTAVQAKRAKTSQPTLYSIPFGPEFYFSTATLAVKKIQPDGRLSLEASVL